MTHHFDLNKGDPVGMWKESVDHIYKDDYVSLVQVSYLPPTVIKEHFAHG